MSEDLTLFEDKQIRHIYDEEKNKWYFSVEDIVKILTDSVNSKDYIKKLRKRDLELSEGWGQFVPTTLKFFKKTLVVFFSKNSNFNLFNQFVIFFNR